MNDHNINEEWLSQHQWQPGMPSPDEAWGDMLAKLDKEMPDDNTLSQAGKQKVSHNHSLYLIMLMLLLMNIKHTNEYPGKQQENAHAIKATPLIADKNKQQQVTGLNNEIPAIAETQITGNNSNNKQVMQAHRTHNTRHILKATLASTQKGNNTTVEKSKPIVYDTVGAMVNDENAILNNKETAIQKPKSVTIHPTDSAQNSDEENEEKLLVQAGLQWTASVPIAGTGNYFAGPSGKEQPWRALLPGAWVSVKVDKNILMAEVNPFAAASFNPKPFYSNKEFADSLSILETFKSITKVFGISGAISVQHNITGNWWAGAGLQASFWKKGVAVLRVNKHNGVTNTSSSSSNLYVLSKDDWQYFSKMQLYPHLQLMYRSNSYQAGLRTGITFTSLAQDAGAKNLVFSELFFRLPLISNNKK